MSSLHASGTSRASLVFAVGAVISVGASLLPGWILERRNAATLNQDTLAIERALVAELDAQVKEFEQVSPRWVKGEPLAVGDASTERTVLGTPPAGTPTAMFRGFTAIESPYELAEGERPDVMSAVSVARGKEAYEVTNLFVSTDLPDIQRKQGLEPIPTADERPRIASLKLTALQAAQLFPSSLQSAPEASADSEPQTSAGARGNETLQEVWTLAYPVKNRGWLVAPVASDGFANLINQLARSKRLDISVFSGADEQAPLMARQPLKNGTTTLRRTTSTVTHLGQTFTFAVSAEKYFSTSSPPNQSLLFVSGLLGSAFAAAFVGSRQNKKNARILNEELGAANRLARTDALTNLPNRLGINERLEQFVGIPTQQPMALLLVDLDRFKIVNDARGHDAGDRLLIDVADRVQKSAPASFVGRLGGDEFVILLADATTEEAVDVGHQIVARLREPFTLDADQVVIGSSVGLSFVPVGTVLERSTLLRDADLAMYAAKRDGGNRVCVITDDVRRMSGGQLDTELDLRKAFGTNQLVTWYQPLVNPHGTVMALEALVRWQHPTKGLLAPGQFLPAAKRAGLLAEISTTVLSQACHEVAMWNRQRVARGQHPVVVHVNCVEEQLMDASFADVVGSYIAASGIDPEHLVLEISEETALDRLPKGLPTIAALTAIGVRFSLDDFGFGNASLTMVRQLGGVSEIKLDKSIVDGLAAEGGPSEADLSVIQAVRSFCESQGIAMVAEGVELAMQRDLLVDLGVDLLQGYLFSKPQPSEIVGNLLVPEMATSSATATSN